MKKLASHAFNGVIYSFSNLHRDKQHSEEEIFSLAKSNTLSMTFGANERNPKDQLWMR